MKRKKTFKALKVWQKVHLLVLEVYKVTKDFLHFLNMAESSLEETKYHLILSNDLGFINGESHRKLNEMCDEVGRMLCGLQKSLTP